MAFSGREVMVMVNAQNRASGVFRQVGSDMRALSAEANRAGRAWGNLGRVGSTLSHLGRTAQVMGLAVGAGIGYAAHQAATLQTSVELAATQTTSNFGRMQKNAKVIFDHIVKDMQKFPASSKDMSQAAYDIYSSLDVNLNQGMRLLDLFNKASVAGMTPLTDVTQHAITIMNDFGITTEHMSKVFQRSFATVRFGRVTFEQYTQSMNQLVPAFAAAGQSFNTMSGAFAFLTRKMPSSRMAATALARMIEIFGRAKMIDGLKKAGVEIVGVNNKLLPLPEILDKINKKFPQLARGGVDLQQFFKKMSGTEGTIQARRAFTFFMEDLKGYHDLSTKVVNDNNEFDKSFKGLNKSSGVQFKDFMNTLRAMMIVLGDAAIPALVAMLKPLKDAVEWFQKLSDSTKASIGKWAVYGAAIALVTGTILSISGAVISFISILGRFGILGLTFTTGVLAVAAALEFMKNGFQGVNTVITGFANLMTFKYGWTGFVAGALAVVAVVRKLIDVFRALKVAIVEAQAVNALGGAGQMALFGGGGTGAKAAEGGMLATMFGAPRGIRAAGQSIKTAYAEAAAGVMATRTKWVRASVVGAERSPLTSFLRDTRAPLMMGGAGTALASRDIEKEVQVAARGARTLSMLKGAGAGAAAGLSMVPGPLWAIGAALAAVGVGALLWQHHMANVKKHAEEAKVAAESLALTLNAGPRAFASATGLGLNLRGVAGAKLDVKDLTHQLSLLRKEQNTPGADKVAVGIQIQRAILNRADAIDVLRRTQGRATAGATAFTRGVRATAQALVNYGMVHKQIQPAIAAVTMWQKLENTSLRAGGGAAYAKELNAAKNNLRQLRAEQQLYQKSVIKSGDVAGVSFKRIVKDMQNAQMLPGKIGPQQMSTALGAALRLAQGGQKIGLAKIKMLIQAELDPFSIRLLPKKVQAALKASSRQQVQIQMKIKSDAKAQQGIKAILKTTKLDQIAHISPHINAAALNTTKSSITGKFKTPIPQPIHLGPVTPDALGLGASIASGVAKGINNGAIQAAAVAAATSAIAAAKAAIGSHSPSTKARDEIGIPFTQGIMVGIYKGTPALEQAARVSVNLMAGAAVQAFQGIQMPTLFSGKVMDDWDKKTKQLATNLDHRAARISTRKVKYKSPLPNFKLGFGLELKDLTNQVKDVHTFMSSLDQLRARNVPEKLLEQLAALGTDGAKFIVKLTTASKKELDKYVKLWSQADKEIKNAVNFDVLLADLKGQLVSMQQFNASMRKLQAEHVPAKLLDQLSQLGADGAMMLAQLAHATKKQLAEYVATWKKTEAEVRKSTRYMAEDQQQLAIDGAQALYQMYNDTKSNLQGFVDLWPAALQDMSGSNYASALADYNSQLSDLTQQLNDVTTQALADAKNNLQQQMGQLFDFSNMPTQQTKIDWGVALSMDDLKAQLKQQVDLFKGWQADLTALKKRNVPQGLIDQLAALGPSAKGNLDVLIGSSDKDLSDYVALWQDGQAAIGVAAKDTIKSSVDILKQIADIEKQIHDLAKPHAMTSDDVVKSLQDQKDQFTKYSDTLDALRKKKVPILLLQQLEALGPDALPLLESLNNMTSDQLGQYEKIWSDTQDRINKESMNQLNDQIKLWREQGRNIADALINGVADEQPKLLKFFRQLFISLLTGKNPPKNPNTKTNDPAVGGKSLSTILVTLVNPPINMTVNAMQGEDLMTTMNKSTWKIQARRP